MSSRLLIMKNFIPGLIFIFLSTTTLTAEAEILHADEWLLPKQAATILALPAISKSMEQLQKDASSSLLLKYPGGDEGNLWVNELRSWLITLGLSSKRIELIQGSANSTAIELEILSTQVIPVNTISTEE